MSSSPTFNNYFCLPLIKIFEAWSISQVLPCHTPLPSTPPTAPVSSLIPFTHAQILFPGAALPTSLYMQAFQPLPLHSKIFNSEICFRFSSNSDNSGWSGGSTVKSTCSCRGQQFNSQHPHDHCPYLISVPEDPIPSPGLWEYQTHMEYIDIEAGRTPINIKSINKSKHTFKWPQIPIMHDTTMLQCCLFSFPLS